MTDDRYPIGPFQAPAGVSVAGRAAAIGDIRETPRHLRAALEGLTNAQLDTPYREGGWTIRQVAHHLVDSHLNAYARVKLALTEDAPVIKPYDEAAWARLADSSLPVGPSVTMLESLHVRWVTLLDNMGDSDFRRVYVHPETGRHTLDYLVALYAWHGKHHVAHVTTTRARHGWS